MANISFLDYMTKMPEAGADRKLEEAVPEEEVAPGKSAKTHRGACKSQSLEVCFNNGSVDNSFT